MFYTVAQLLENEMKMRIARGMDVQWRRKDGRTWDIPRLPMTTHDKFTAPKATK